MLNKRRFYFKETFRKIALVRRNLQKQFPLYISWNKWKMNLCYIFLVAYKTAKYIFL